MRLLQLTLLALGFSSACQVAFGDFEVDSSKLVVTCKPNGARCLNGKLQLCVNGNDWRDEKVCGSGDLCNLAKLDCVACQPGSFQCSDRELQRCGDDRKWKKQDTCVTASLCQVSDDAGAGSCANAGCDTPGKHRCAPGAPSQLQRCPVNQTALEDVELCATPAQCDAAAADQQVSAGAFATCQLAACNPGQFSCETGSPRPCKADRTDWDAELTTCGPNECNVETGDCSPCTTDTYRCSGPTLQRCNARSTWEILAQCASVELCSAAERTCVQSVVPPCAPGQFRCDKIFLERCRSDGAKWEQVDVCASSALCDSQATRCTAPKCLNAEATRCNGLEYQQCRENLTGWVTQSTCSPGEQCDPIEAAAAGAAPNDELRCVPGNCLEGAFRCNDVLLEQCEGAAWVKKKTCETHALCDATEKKDCLQPVCAADELRCLGRLLQVCNEGRNDWDTRATCNGTLKCSSDTKRCEES